MRLQIYQVDAFTDRVFAGNPAAVVPLERWLPDATLRAIAAENNLSETAFYVPVADGRWELRWFTPEIEVDLCGHATLATAWVIAHRGGEATEPLRFMTREAGELAVTREGELFVLDFPARPAERIDPPRGIAEALGHAPAAVLRARKTMAVLGDPEIVETLAPDLAWIAALPGDGLIVTAPGKDVDFVSRYFAPHAGIDEDPVTGSAHCTLAPYWGARLGKSVLHARQVSRRGGVLRCELAGDRVRIAGRAAAYLEGTIEVP
jgi:PhzF family phenazine biosynthesis protein